jgi:hypothetical protein
LAVAVAAESAVVEVSLLDAVSRCVAESALRALAELVFV